MIKFEITITQLENGQINVQSVFDNDSNVINILSALGQTHNILQEKLNETTMDETKRKTICIKDFKTS